jgi:ubiquitin carboxyl-terminal hydrolase 10
MNDSFLLLLEDGQSQNNPQQQQQHDHASVHVARGLTNRGNACYMNAVLQLLMGISPFFTALKSLPYYTQIPESCPFTRCCVELCGLYHEAQKNEIKVASSVTPSMFYDLFSKLGPKSHFYSILYSVQEDAVEFCTYLLNALHTEAAESVQSQSAKKKSGGGEKEVTMEKNEDQEGWNRVTKGKRSEKVDSSVTFGLSSTYVSSLFVGCQQLVLRKAGSGVSVQEQPFFVLPVDISDTRIKSVEDGLRALSASNTIEGYMHNGVPVACSQQTVISSLPPVLFIQLQRFLYWGADAEKNSRMITYSDRLVLPAQSCVASAAPVSMRTYRLHGVMTHVGEQAGAGHYVVDVKYGNKWLCFDDELVTPVSNEAAVNRLAYLLVYVREP